MKTIREKIYREISSVNGMVYMVNFFYILDRCNNIVLFIIFAFYVFISFFEQTTNSCFLSSYLVYHMLFNDTKIPKLAGKMQRSDFDNIRTADLKCLEFPSTGVVIR